MGATFEGNTVFNQNLHSWNVSSLLYAGNVVGPKREGTVRFEKFHHTDNVAQFWVLFHVYSSRDVPASIKISAPGTCLLCKILMVCLMEQHRSIKTCAVGERAWQDMLPEQTCFWAPPALIQATPISIATRKAPFAMCA